MFISTQRAALKVGRQRMLCRRPLNNKKAKKGKIIPVTGRGDP
jgi:hypothetical protein